MLSWMAGRGTGAGRLPHDHLGDRIRGAASPFHNHKHSEKCAQQKLTPLKCCARPASMEHFKCPSEVGLPHRYPEQLATSFWLPQKCKNKKMGTGVPPVFAFSTKLSKNSGRYRRPYKKMQHLLLCPFWRGVASFFVFFRLFCPPHVNLEMVRQVRFSAN